jgi:TRAP-type mannitol/chloroaromatic compound transport system substrate-binding protein
MGTWATRGLVYEKIVYDRFCEMVNKMSNGRLIIEVAYDGEGYSVKELVSTIKTGLIDMGELYQGYYTGQIPAGVVELGLPGGPEDIAWLSYLHYHTDFQKVLEAAYGTFKIYPLGRWFWPKPVMITKNEIKSVNDLKNLKVRAPGMYGKMLRNLGITPVALSFGEMYTGAATGVIDATAGSPLSDFFDVKIHEVLHYIYPQPLAASQATSVVINKEKFDSLPNDLKEILLVASRYIGFEVFSECKKIEQEAIKQMMKSGLKYSPDPSKEDIQAWRAAGAAIWDEYASEDKYSKELIEIQRGLMETIK